MVDRLFKALRRIGKLSVHIWEMFVTSPHNKNSDPQSSRPAARPAAAAAPVVPVTPPIAAAIKAATAPAPLPHPWSRDALLTKAHRYAEAMLAESPTEWKHVLWSTFALELLGRAALAHVSPALLAETKNVKDWQHLYFALGFQPLASKFTPFSISVAEVFDRLSKIEPKFNSDLVGFAVSHMGKRNEELHSGKTPFDDGDTKWQARYYEACDVLLQFMGESLELLFGATQATTARAQIAAANDESAKSVAKLVHTHQTAWKARTDDDRKTATAQAAVWAVRQEGHRVTCPACGSTALVTGKAAAPAITNYDNEHIIEKQTHLPSAFECVACGLKILGLAQIAASGLGDTYIATHVYSLEEYYQNNVGGFDIEPDMNEF